MSLEYWRAEVPDRLARLTDVGLDLATNARQLLACAHRRWTECVTMPSNCRATPTRLCSRVSWISRLSRARSARASENCCRTSASRNRQTSTRARGDHGGHEGVEPTRLIDGRLDRKCPIRRRRTPRAVLGMRFDTEAIVARGEVGVEDSASRTGIHPVGVEAIEPIAKRMRFGAAKARTVKTQLETTCSCGEPVLCEIRRWSLAIASSIRITGGPVRGFNSAGSTSVTPPPHATRAGR